MRIKKNSCVTEKTFEHIWNGACGALCRASNPILDWVNLEFLKLMGLNNHKTL